MSLGKKLNPEGDRDRRGLHSTDPAYGGW